MTERREIIIHHAIAVDWLVAQLAQATGKDPDKFRILAFEVALEKADKQDEAYLDAVLKTNLKAFKRAGLNRVHGAQHGKFYRLGGDR